MESGERLRLIGLAGLGACLLLLGAWLLSGPDEGPPPAEPPPAEPTASVQGVVIDTDGRPVEGARVYVHPDEFRCVSGVDGAFRFPAPPGARLLLFALPDAASLGVSLRPEARRVNADAGGPAVVLPMAAGAALHFRLSVPGAEGVRAVLGDGEGLTLRRGEFDAEGRFDVAGLSRTEPVTLYARTADFELSARIDDIEPHGQEIAVTLAPSLTIRGVVNLPEGAVLQRVRPVFYAVRTDDRVGPGTTFTIRGLPPGVYRLQATALLDGEQISGQLSVKAGTQDACIPIRTNR